MIFGHTNAGPDVKSILRANKDIPILYVKGNKHKYCMEFLDEEKFPDLLELTVDAFLASPLFISVAKDDRGRIFFHVESTPFECNP